MAIGFVMDDMVLSERMKDESALTSLFDELQYGWLHRGAVLAYRPIGIFRWVGKQMGDAFDHMFGAQGEAAVHQHRSQLLLRHAHLQNQQRAELGIPVLLHHKADVVFGEKCMDALVEGKSAYAHIVRLDA